MHKCRYIIPILREQLHIEELYNLDAEDIRNKYEEFDLLYKLANRAVCEEEAENMGQYLEETIEITKDIMSKITNKSFELKEDFEQ
ncbi:MAG: hypothetical protein ACI4GD_10125 [Lachnospiraceae bacterium]